MTNDVRPLRLPAQVWCVGLTRQTIAAIEQGALSSLDVAFRIAHVFGNGWPRCFIGSRMRECKALLFLACNG